jgi:hypothetical protein
VEEVEEELGTSPSLADCRRLLIDFNGALDPAYPFSHLAQRRLEQLERCGSLLDILLGRSEPCVEILGGNWPFQSM